MIIFAVVPQVRMYEERFATFQNLGSKACRVYLLSIDESPSLLSGRSEVTHWVSGKGGIRFIFFIWSHLLRVVWSAPRGEPIIVHDCFFGRAAPLAALLRLVTRRKVLIVLSLFASNRDLLSRRAWHQGRGDRDKKIEWYYYKITLLRIAGDFISALFADDVCGNSPMVTEGLVCSGVPPRKLRVLPTAVDTGRFYPDPSAPLPPVVNPDRRFILYAGRLLLWRKGLDTLITAFQTLHAADPGIDLFLLGSHDALDRPYLERAIQTSGIAEAILLFSTMDSGHLRALYSRAELFIHPSLNEGTPRTLKEALACGTPAVVSDIPAHEIIPKNQNVLSFVPPGDPARLAQTIQRLLADLPERRRRGESGREYISSHYSIPAVAQSHIALYHDWWKKNHYG